VKQKKVMATKNKSKTKITNKIRESFETQVTKLAAKHATSSKILAFKTSFAAKKGLSLGQVHAMHAWLSR
jgi:hypothetical protein